MSSTSNDVCELWSGSEVVRAIGQPQELKQLIILKDKLGRNEVGFDENIRILDLKQAYATGVLVPDSPIDDKELSQLMIQAPNITLNVKNSTSSRNELRSWAILGALVQMGAVAFIGITVYHWKWKKGGNDIAVYGYPCFLVGTLCLIVGTVLCSHVIEGSTREREFRPPNPSDTTIQHIICLQKSCTVSEQHFQSYAIFNGHEDLLIRTSRRESKRYFGKEGTVSFPSLGKSLTFVSLLAAVSTFISITGFIAQFVGLRALHWSATVTQLGVTLAMTFVRAWVRRGLAAGPVYRSIKEKHETAWLALFVSQGDEILNRTDSTEIRDWELYTGYYCPSCLLEFDYLREWRMINITDSSPTIEPIIGYLPYRIEWPIQLHMQLQKI